MIVSNINSEMAQTISLKKEEELEFDSSSFSSFFSVDGKSLNDLIDEVLETKDEISQTAHKESITKMKEKGYSDEELYTLHNLLLSIEKNGKENLELSSEEEALLSEYQNKFEEVQLELKKAKERYLQSKKEFVNDAIIANLLKIKE